MDVSAHVSAATGPARRSGPIALSSHAEHGKMEGPLGQTAGAPPMQVSEAPSTDRGASIEQLFRLHAPTIARWVSRLGGPGIDVDDAVQEVFLVAHRRWETYDPRAAQVSTWLYAITLNVVRHTRRRQRVRALLPARLQRSGPPPATETSPAERLENREIVACVQAVLDRLSPSQREAFMLFEMEGLSGPEIFALTGRNPTTMRVHLHRARALFTEALQTYDPDLGRRRTTEEGPSRLRGLVLLAFPAPSLAPDGWQRLMSRLTRPAAGPLVGWVGLGAGVSALVTLMLVAPRPDTAGVSTARTAEGSGAAPLLAVAPTTVAAPVEQRAASREAASCRALSPGPDLALCGRRQISALAGDRVAGLALAADGTVLVAGVFGSLPEGTRITLFGEGRGTVVRLSADARTIVAAARLGAEIHDVAIHRDTGDVLLALDGSVVRLDAALDRIVWRQPIAGSAVRIDVADDGGAILLDGANAVHVLASDGSPNARIALPDDKVTDVAWHPRGFIVTGSNRRMVCRRPTETAFVAAIGADGASLWRAYDRAGAGERTLCSATRGAALTRGRDGHLYFAGIGFGADTAFLRDPLNAAHPAPISDAPSLEGTLGGAAPFTLAARLDASTGALLAGQVLAVRVDARQPSSLRAAAIAADERGAVTVVGIAGCCLPGRDQFRLDGQPVPPYAVQDSFVAVLPPSMEGRTTFVSFATGALGALGHVDVAAGHTAVAGGPWKIPSKAAGAAKPSDANGVHVATWRTNDR